MVRIGKSWNRKGSHSAKEHMAWLRDKKLQHTKRDLINEWSRVTGRPAVEWWQEAQAAGLVAGCGNAACIEFLRSTISNNQSA